MKRSPCFMDDLESLMYVIYFLNSGTLPAIDAIIKEKKINPRMQARKILEKYRSKSI